MQRTKNSKFNLVQYQCAAEGMLHKDHEEEKLIIEKFSQMFHPPIYGEFY